MDNFRLYGEPVNVRIQQDTHEFFNVLCDQIEQLTKKDNFLPKIIGGTLCNETRSLEQEYPYVGEKLEEFYTIPLDIKDKRTIQEALDLYVKPDVLEGDNKYHCEEHDKKISAQRRTFINDLSDTVVLNLKRFEFDFNTLQRRKLNDYCEFPDKIDFRPWTRDGISGKEDKNFIDEEVSENAASVESGEQVKHEAADKYLYQLSGVLIHSGGADAGHYYSYIKDRSDQKWFEFNDTRVSDFDLKNLKKEAFGG